MAKCDHVTTTLQADLYTPYLVVVPAVSQEAAAVLGVTAQNSHHGDMAIRAALAACIYLITYGAQNSTFRLAPVDSLTNFMINPLAPEFSFKF